MAPDSPLIEQKLARDQIAFWLAVTDFSAIAIWFGIRLYFAMIGDQEGDRKFVLHPALLQLFPIIVLIWIISFVTVGNGVLKTRRVSSQGLWTLILLAFPAAPVIIVIGQTYWKFFATS